MPCGINQTWICEEYLSWSLDIWHKGSIWHLDDMYKCYRIVINVMDRSNFDRFNSVNKIVKKMSQKRKTSYPKYKRRLMWTKYGQRHENNAFEYAQNMRIGIILHMRKVLSGNLLCIETFNAQTDLCRRSPCFHMAQPVYERSSGSGRAHRPSKHTTSKQRRYNVAATSWRYSDFVTTLFRHCVFAGGVLLVVFFCFSISVISSCRVLIVVSSLYSFFYVFEDIAQMS